ncbi:MAG: hypothetical protein AB1393_01285 [Candidatus Edwardsbacteria bacterium]
MSFWELLTLMGVSSTILGIFLILYAVVNNRTLKQEQKLTRELIDSAFKTLGEEERLTRELIEEGRKETQRLIEKISQQIEKVPEKTAVLMR